jgi:acetyl-CoA synthetase
MIGGDGADRSSSFAEMAARSDQLATSLAATGVAQRDRVMAMLGNHVALWESMLAVMKLGVVIMPAATALEQRPRRTNRAGRLRHAITNADQFDKFADSTGDFDRIAVGHASHPWRPCRLADAVASPSRLAARQAASATPHRYWDYSWLSIESF